MATNLAPDSLLIYNSISNMTERPCLIYPGKVGRRIETTVNGVNLRVYIPVDKALEEKDYPATDNPDDCEIAKELHLAASQFSAGAKGKLSSVFNCDACRRRMKISIFRR